MFELEQGRRSARLQTEGNSGLCLSAYTFISAEAREAHAAEVERTQRREKLSRSQKNNAAKRGKEKKILFLRASRPLRPLYLCCVRFARLCADEGIGL